MSVGRGRGRGFAEARETTLRRPGQSFTPKFGSLINLIENMTIEEVNSKVDDIAQAINDSIKNNSLKEVFEDLHNQALEDGDFVEKLAIACSNTKVYSIDNNNLRFILLQTLQKDFEEREQIKNRSVAQFRNSVSLLGEVYLRLKINGTNHLNILVEPLLQYLEILLQTAEEDDIALVTNMILVHGEKLHEISPEKFEDVLIQVRAVLIYRNLSARSRGTLVYILDVFHKSTGFSEKTKAFYNDQVEHLAKFVKINVNNRDNAQSKSPKNKSVQPTAENNVGNVSKTPKQGETPGGAVHENSPLSPSNERPSIPRAIRGAGAVDNAKDKNIKKPLRQKKKLTDEQIWSSKQNTSSKVWGHDDRFEKDY